MQPGKPSSPWPCGQADPSDVLSPIMASERIQRRIDSLLDEADQAIANEDWITVAIEHSSSHGIYLQLAEGEMV